jgi:hypothetical protein
MTFREKIHNPESNSLLEERKKYETTQSKTVARKSGKGGRR